MLFYVTPKYLNWEILTKNLATFNVVRWDWGKDEKF